MLPLFVSHLISINCFPLQWICLLKRIHPACIYSYTAQHFSCQQTDTSLFTQLESGLFFCFLETSLRSAIILSLMKTVAPAERNSTYVFNTAHVVLVPKEIFFYSIKLAFSTRLHGSSLPIQEASGQKQLFLSNKIRFSTWGPCFENSHLGNLEVCLWAARGRWWPCSAWDSSSPKQAKTVSAAGLGPRWPQPAATWSRTSVPWSKTEVRLGQWGHWILATRPPGRVASDKALGPLAS